MKDMRIAKLTKQHEKKSQVFTRKVAMHKKFRSVAVKGEAMAKQKEVLAKQKASAARLDCDKKIKGYLIFLWGWEQG